MKRLSDTKALVAQGLRPAQLCTADEYPKPAYGSADKAVEPKPEFSPMYSFPEEGRKTRPEPGVGTSTLGSATKICKE